MGEQTQVATEFGDQELRAFVKALLRDVKALEALIDRGMIETGVRRIGAEQEMFLVDRALRPAPLVLEVLDRLRHPQFTTELARFNLEANLSPMTFGGSCLRQMERETNDLLQRAREAAQACGASIVLCGILPTLELHQLGLENMVPNPRYLTLNRALRKLRGGSFHFRIKGLDEVDIVHDNVMLESCNTSFQVHFQAGPEEFARLYNLAQAITAPVLAAAVNSPLLLGRRLWDETRVALFQQSVDARSEAHQARGHRPRVSFGDGWVKSSVLEIFREDIARFRVLLATGIDEDPEAVVARGEAPKLTAMRLHNGTVYRWNRACYGVHDGKAHLRIEARALPAGPTVRDQVANAALFFGLMSALSEEHREIDRVMEFDHAKENFVSAARRGLKAQFTWIKGESFTAERLLLDRLLPLARQGLAAHQLDSSDIDLYLGIVEERVRSGRTGAQWVHNSLAAMAGKGTRDQRMRTLVRAMLTRQQAGEPVHTWAPATMAEIDDWRASYLRVGQYMATDLFTVRPEDLVDLAASLMEWEHIRHVPVEDDDGNLVGLVTHRSLLRNLGGMAGEQREPVAVREIMKANPVTVTPYTSTLDAIELMRKHHVGCLPVVEGRRLVGIVTERDLLDVAARLFEEQLREAQRS
jgi:CBS domain-containing protein/gamma-glutamyl:cysteine ligase YbdK (ATP-grasp superfamily)